MQLIETANQGWPNAFVTLFDGFFELAKVISLDVGVITEEDEDGHFTLIPEGSNYSVVYCAHNDLFEIEGFDEIEPETIQQDTGDDALEVAGALLWLVVGEIIDEAIDDQG